MERDVLHARLAPVLREVRGHQARRAVERLHELDDELVLGCEGDEELELCGKAVEAPVGDGAAVEAVDGEGADAEGREGVDCGVDVGGYEAEFGDVA